MSDPTPTPRPQQAEQPDQPDQPDQPQVMPRTQPVQPLSQTHPTTARTQPLQPTPQDAPLHPTTRQAGGQPTGPRAPSVSTPQASLPEREVRYLPRPTGPSWGLVLMGLAFVVVAAGVMANQVSGFRVGQLADTGPGVLVGVGLLCALIGIVGMVARRRQ
jgi:hypothetical protein